MNEQVQKWTPMGKPRLTDGYGNTWTLRQNIDYVVDAQDYSELAASTEEALLLLKDAVDRMGETDSAGDVGTLAATVQSCVYNRMQRLEDANARREQDIKEAVEAEREWISRYYEGLAEQDHEEGLDHSAHLAAQLADEIRAIPKNPETEGNYG